MSLLNQVLNDLEKRGANGPLVDMPIRAVHARSRRSVWVYVAGAAVLLGVIAAAGWALHKPVVPAALVISAPPIPEVNVLVPVAQIEAVSQVVAELPPHAESQVVVADPAVEEYAIAPRLSVELSLIPLPESSRAKPLVELAAPIRNIAPPVEANQSNAGTRAESHASISKQMKIVSTQQQAENEFRKASLMAQQGRYKEAAAGYAAALHLDSAHDLARQSLVAVLLESKLNADAEKTLREGLALNPKQTHFAMLLARLQVERNALPAALATLEKGLSYADNSGDYQAFVAALLQRQSRHKEAITHYQIALQLSPNSGVWLMGLGISLQAVQRKEDALDAYRRAIESRSLSPDLQAFVMQRMKEIKS